MKARTQLRVGWNIVPATTGLLLLLAFTIAEAAVFDVSSVQELTNAMATAQSNGENDTIRISAGTYTLSSATLTYDSTEDESLKLEASGGEVVLDGEFERVLYIWNRANSTNAWVTLDGITIKDGFVIEDYGAGAFIRTQRGDITIKNSRVEGCSSKSFYFSSQAAGIFAKVEGGGTVFFLNNIISNNTAKGTGGGAYLLGGLGASVVMRNNLFTENYANTKGGGAYVSVVDGTVSIQNNTFVSNQTAFGEGGGGFHLHMLQNTCTADIRNNLFWHNTTQNGLGDDFYIKDDGNGDNTGCAISVFYNNFADMDYQDGDHLSQGANMNSDPLMGADMHIPLDSPCTDAGTNQSWMTGARDMDGHNRIYNGRVDIGADEYGTSVLFVAMSSASSDPTKVSPIPVTVQFTDDVGGFTNTDVALGNAVLTNFVMVNGSNYTFDMVPSGQGQVTADIGANAATNASGNGNEAADQFIRTYDSTAPSVSMSSASSDPAKDSPISVTVTFSENVSGFVSGDIVPGNASVGDFVVVSGSNYTFDLTPSGQGQVTADIAADVAQDAAGNNTAAAQFNRVYDSVQPTVAMLSGAPDPTRDSPIVVTARFSEVVSGFTNTDISVVNASVGNFVMVNGTNYTFALSPSGQGLVTANIAADAAADAAGNGSIAAPQFSRVYDTLSPSVSMTSTAGNPTKDSPIPVTVIFSEPVIGFTNTDLTAGNGSIADFTMINATNYAFNVAPLGQGNVTIDIDAGAAQDNAGNDSSAADQFGRTYDTIAPAPSPITWQTVPFVLSASAVGMGANSAADDNPPINYLFENITAATESGWQSSRGWTNDALNPNTRYSYRARAKDAAGNQGVWSVTNHVCTLANVPSAPAAAIEGVNVRVTLAAAPTGGVYNADGNPSNTQYAVGMITNSIGTNFVNFSGNVTTSVVWGVYTNWGADNGVLITNLDHNATNAFVVMARNLDNTQTAFGAGTNVTFDPKIIISSVAQRTNGTGLIDFEVTAWNPMTNSCGIRIRYGYHDSGPENAINPTWVSADSLMAGYGTPSVDNGATQQIAGVSTTNFTNTVSFAWDTQSAGNPLTLGGQHTKVWIALSLYDEVAGICGPTVYTNFWVDNERPECTILRLDDTPSTADKVAFLITFSEKVAGFSIEDVTLHTSGTDGTLDNFSGSDENYLVDVTGVSGDGTIGISVTDNKATDAAGNHNVATAHVDYQIDNTAPVIALSEPSSSLVNTGPVTYTLTYSGADTVSLAAGNVTLNGTGTAKGSLSVSGSGDVQRTVTVSGISGDGTLCITVAANTAADTAGNQAGPVTGASFTVDNTAPSVTMSSTADDLTPVTPIPVTVTFSEAVTGFYATDVSAGNATLANFVALSSSQYTFDLVPSAGGSVSADIAAGVVEDAAGNGNAAATQLTRTYGLSAPENVAASDGSHTDKVAVAWSAVFGATAYEVHRSTASESGSATELGETTATDCDDTSAVPGTTYYYWVKARNSKLASSFSSGDSGYRASGASVDNSVPVPVYRLYSYGAAESTYEHLWTTSETEKDTLDSWPSWQYEGIAWYAHTNAVDGTVPLYRLYEPSVMQHHYTINETEYSVLANGAWNGEGIQYYVYPTDSLTDLLPAYRFYHAGVALHHFTIDESEKGFITAHPEWGYVYEGVGFYVFATNVVGSGFTVEGSRLEDENSSPVRPAVHEDQYSVGYERGDPGEEDATSPSSLNTVHCPLPTDLVEVPGDYDGDGIEDIAYYKESTGTWFIPLANLDGQCSMFSVGSSSSSTLQPAPRLVAPYRREGGSSESVVGSADYSLYQWGGPGFTPLSGDYDGDGADDLAVYHEETGTWFIRNALPEDPTRNPDSTTRNQVILWAATWGGPDYLPIALDYDADGTCELAVYSLLSDEWYIGTQDGNTIVWKATQ